MQRFLAAALSASLPVLVAAPAHADVGRTLQYAVVATNAGIARHAEITVDFIGGSAERVMKVNVGEVEEGGARQAAYIAIDASGSLRSNGVPLTAEEDAICGLMSLESEDMDGVGVGDRWEREGPVPGGRHHTRYAVVRVRDGGLIELAVARDVSRGDGTVARWSGTLLYDATDFVPASIALRGSAGSLTIRLIHDTFKHY